MRLGLGVAVAICVVAGGAQASRSADGAAAAAASALAHTFYVVEEIRPARPGLFAATTSTGYLDAAGGRGHWQVTSGGKLVATRCSSFTPSRRTSGVKGESVNTSSFANTTTLVFTVIAIARTNVRPTASA